MSVRESVHIQTDAAAEPNFYHFICCGDDCGGPTELTAEVLIATVTLFCIHYFVLL